MTDQEAAQRLLEAARGHDCAAGPALAAVGEGVRCYGCNRRLDVE